MTSDRIDDLIALAALGELSEDEARELDGAVRADPEVAAELSAALEAAAQVQSSVPEAPPPGLRESVMAAIASTPQESDAAAAIVPEAPVSLDRERQGRRRWVSALAAAAAVAVIVAGGVALFGDETAAPGQIAAVVDAPDAQRRSLVGELGGTLTVVYSGSQGAIVVDGDGLPLPDDTATYQLWLVDDDGATSIGVFRPDPDGSVAERFDGVDPTGLVLGVTLEPAGGSTVPTLPILASA